MHLYLLRSIACWVCDIIKVLIVHPYMAFYGGAETLILHLLDYLNKNDIQSSLATLSLNPQLADLCSKTEFITPKKTFEYKLRSTGLLNALGISKDILELRGLIKQRINQFDVINVHNFPATWSVYPNNGPKKPVIWMCNEPPDLWNNPHPSLFLKLLKDIGLACDRYIVNKAITEICVADDFNHRRILERYGRESDIIYYGIDYDIFSRGQDKAVIEKYHLDEKFIVLQAGVLTPQKNQLHSIKAIEALRRHIPNIKLILAGLGANSYEQTLREYVQYSDLDQYVLFTGHISKQELADLYKACNAAIFPTKSQGGWLAPFEAMCAKKPVIVSPEMTASSLLKKEKIAVITNDFTKAILDIYENPNKYIEIGNHGHEWVKDNLGWERFSHDMVKIFNASICKERHP